MLDKAQRIKALDPSSSFIVQAPAGSGKTELLTQRFLVLLARAQYPEEIIAITFTRKAAAEMRARIIDALLIAANHPPPSSFHGEQTWKLAKDVLKRDKKENWQLLNNPNRLKVMTIDSLCARIARSFPVVSHFGKIPKIIENPEILYVEAAHRLLETLNNTTSWSELLTSLLLHLDHNYQTAEKLLVGMLKRRDQWLNFIMTHRHENAREVLERSLQNIIADTLANAYTLFPIEKRSAFLVLFNFSSLQLGLPTVDTFPESDVSQYPIWQCIAQLLLTQTHDWRRSINKNCGFPPATEASCKEEQSVFKMMKKNMNELLEKFSDHEPLRLALKDILLLPAPSYEEEQWEIVNALIGLLPILVAYLMVIFREQNVSDFIAIAQGALHALEENEEITDIKLSLDYQIRHLLVDEFQDTSSNQHRLLQLLTSGWENNDGRTLFLVGDPMQSIYRFREADVGIFLNVKNNGLGNIALVPLKLEINFRSSPTLVNWFNSAFKSIFPANENAELGAIPFSFSTAFMGNQQSEARVKIHSFLNPEKNDEADYVAELVKQELEQNPSYSIAILVRSRSHLHRIIPKLKKENINFHAVEVEKLFSSSLIQDLFSLTKALTHLGEKIAWFAVLRAPWCGLCLHDLYLIAHYNQHNTLFETLKEFELINGLSEDAIMRLQRIMPILEHAIQERERNSVRAWIADTWYALGGPACVEEEHELINAEAYFNLLDEFFGNLTIETSLLENKLRAAYSHSTSSETKVHLMTIHKSKGLEFDVVIMPGLERKPTNDENQLLLWLEKQNSQGEIDLLLAPIRSTEAHYDPIYRYIRSQEFIKLQFEISRLLYVAMTRAKVKLHLLGTLNKKTPQENKEPPTGSFLALLWPFLKEEFHHQNKKEFTDETPILMTTLNRLTSDWQPPTFLPALKSQPLPSSDYHFSWFNPYLAQVGTLIHQLLQAISICGTASSFPLLDKIHLEKKLLLLGVIQQHIPYCLNIIEKAIEQTLKSERGQWILNSDHNEAASEFPISMVDENQVFHYIIDRTFVDEHNVRWIIDYKTSELPDDDESLFLAKAKYRHKDQLENYGRAMQLLDTRKIRLALYFPLFSGWCEWEML